MDIFKTAEDILNEKGSEIYSIGPDALIKDALELMTARRVGAILIRDGNDYIGIWTERDLTRNVISEGFDINTAKVKDYMTTKLIYVQHNDIIFSLIDKFLGLRLRHLLIQREGHFIGMLSMGDVIKAALQQRTDEWERLRDIVKLEYYDQWRWQKKRKK
jgi:signal-transduction protein with cAMP-binding, CBS, and nucleotidyltransferase domain